MNEKRRMAKAALRREWTRRHNRQLPLRHRWIVFKARRRVRATWQQWWTDVVYLVGG